MIVHHKDNEMTNNEISNLERVTYSQNTKYAYRDGRIGVRFKLNPFQRQKVVELYRTGKHNVGELASWFRIHRQMIQSLLRKAGIKPQGMKKLTPLAYDEIREKYIPFKYSISMLAREYNVSRGLIEWILGMRKNRGKLCRVGVPK